MSAYMLYYDATPTVGKTIVVVSVMRLLPCRRGFRAASEQLSPSIQSFPRSGARPPGQDRQRGRNSSTRAHRECSCAAL